MGSQVPETAEADPKPRDAQLVQWLLADLGTKDHANEIHDALLRCGIVSLTKLLHMFEPMYKEPQSTEEAETKIAKMLTLGGLPEPIAMASSFSLGNMFRKHIQSDSKGSNKSTTLTIKQQRGWARSKGTEKNEEGVRNTDARAPEERDGVDGTEGLETSHVDGGEGSQNKKARQLIKKKANDQSKVVGLEWQNVSTADAVTAVLMSEFEIRVIKVEDQALDEDGRPAQKVVEYNPSTPIPSWGQLIGDQAYCSLYDVFNERFEILLKEGEAQLENKFFEFERFETMARDQVEYRRKAWMLNMKDRNEMEAIEKTKLKKGKHVVKKNYRARMLASWDPALTGMPTKVHSKAKADMAKAPSVLIVSPDDAPIEEEEEEPDATGQPAQVEEIILDRSIFQNAQAPGKKEKKKVVVDSDDGDEESEDESEEESGDESEEESEDEGESEEELGEEDELEETSREEREEKANRISRLKHVKMDTKRKADSQDVGSGSGASTLQANNKKQAIAHVAPIATNNEATIGSTVVRNAVNKPFKAPIATKPAMGTKEATIGTRSLRSRVKK